MKNLFSLTAALALAAVVFASPAQAQTKDIVICLDGTGKLFSEERFRPTSTA